MFTVRHIRTPRWTERRYGTLALWVALWSTLGCAAGRRQYPLPMTAAELSVHADGAALVAYLSQPDASAAVCDVRSPGSHFTRMDEEARAALGRGFREGKIAPRVWLPCMEALLRSADAETSRALLGDVLQTALDTVEDPHLEFDAGEQARLDALQQLYAERDASRTAPSALTREVGAALRRDLQANRLGPAGRPRAADLVTLLELERGRWQDRAVDAPVLDSLVEAQDERTLRWAVARLPSVTMRTEARRRIVQLHLRASPFPEVRKEVAAVEDAVMRTGANAISIDDHAPVRGWIEPSLGSAREVLVEQHVPEQSARLLGYTSERPTPSILPELPTRGSLHVLLDGVSAPLTVCAPVDELDVTPCLAPGDVRVETPLATIDPDGVLHFTDWIGEAEAVNLSRQGRRLVVPFTVGGRRVAALEWSLQFRAPPDLVLAGTEPGAPGPSLDIVVDGRLTRLVYSVTAGQRQLQAVVEWEDAPAFHVVSRGAAGHPGTDGWPGSDGSSGSDGWSASCPSSPGSDGSRGQDGSRGGDGGAGGPGGVGGDIRVSVVAEPDARDRVLAVLRTVIRSDGGPGGAGGRGGSGGSGGRGGSGGSGTICTDADGQVTTLPGGASGANGSDGSRGADGPDGPPGRPGQVTFAEGT
ncbi:hypothetical protein [Anaeromyxobacter oryzae]|uniref:Collagen triple helix repeat protein n=1 Tax=Anaeromyxobacter oryzae TaxID=2918170 RepID=A0ABM7WPW5_9BACT|nr:hypothetical protein [Anaeromyxobacter oryzae]BDG01495.1 hypothetical protein AMOR_04910 [Anaeromyxobacter oryzae]